MIRRNVSSGEETFAFHIAYEKLPAAERECRFCPGRRFRFDFAWPEQKFYVEIEGGTWANGRHTRGAGYQADLIKYNLATSLGWRGMRFTTEMVQSGEAIQTVKKMLACRS